MSKTTVTATNQMTAEELEAFLTPKRVGRLGTARKDGSTHLTPMWFLWRDSKVYLILGTSRVHLKNMRRDPRATLCIDDDARLTNGFSAGAQGVVLRCSVELTTNPDVRDSVYKDIAKVYELADDPIYVAARDSEDRVIAVLTPTNTMTWDFRKG